MIRIKKKEEQKIYVSLRSLDGKKEKLETWRYWEIVGALQWMGEDRQTAYDAARLLQQLLPGEKQILPNGTTMEVLTNE